MSLSLFDNNFLQLLSNHAGKLDLYVYVQIVKIKSDMSLIILKGVKVSNGYTIFPSL